MKLRAATGADVPALARVAQRSYQFAFAGILEDDVLASRDAEFFAARFAASLEALIVAVDNENPLGFLLMTDGHIDMLFIDPGSTGKGVGSRLLDYAERKGAKSLECFRDNHGARRFYERYGWRLDREYDREFAGRNRSFVFYVKGETAP
ncbi:GNAT family N-acetyltransferase [Microvirga brassicacearum]|uniref:GNAT family N-acetyltransferase n=1 Tax=Microvirga brassicacearum TaxID=2580413 RepID=UPI00139182CC|nr:GNAT family N-acetyltransferase [Microvirga brassicacearum]